MDPFAFRFGRAVKHICARVRTRSPVRSRMPPSSALRLAAALQPTRAPGRTRCSARASGGDPGARALPRCERDRAQ
eukprot:6188503-Pleurochrysis_carterae.AAC.1